MLAANMLVTDKLQPSAKPLVDFSGGPHTLMYGEPPFQRN